MIPTLQNVPAPFNVDEAGMNTLTTCAIYRVFHPDISISISAE
jgi:hypothetical protein